MGDEPKGQVMDTLQLGSLGKVVKSLWEPVSRELCKGHADELPQCTGAREETTMGPLRGDERWDCSGVEGGREGSDRTCQQSTLKKHRTSAPSSRLRWDTDKTCPRPPQAVDLHPRYQGGQSSTNCCLEGCVDGEAS